MSEMSSKSSTSVKTLQQLELLCQCIAWLLVAIVCSLAITTWGQYVGWKLGSVTVYQFFPLLGLLAFSLMWTHYISGTLRRLLKLDKAVLAPYFKYTGAMVLVLICLHPGLLIYQRFRDGYGLPPHSYESYVNPGLGWVTLLGSVNLLVLLAYEFKRVYGTRSWWHYMQIATDLAMLSIFYHALRLGDELQQGWFVKVWWFYGITLFAVLIYDYRRKYLARFKT